MAIFEKRSFIATQLGAFPPVRKLVVFQIPPATPDAKAVLPEGSFKRSNKKPLIRPDVCPPRVLPVPPPRPFPLEGPTVS